MRFLSVNNKVCNILVSNHAYANKIEFSFIFWWIAVYFWILLPFLFWSDLQLAILPLSCWPPNWTGWAIGTARLFVLVVTLVSKAFQWLGNFHFRNLLRDTKSFGEIQHCQSPCELCLGKFFPLTLLLDAKRDSVRYLISLVSETISLFLPEKLISSFSKVMVEAFPFCCSNVYLAYFMSVKWSLVSFLCCYSLL